MNDTSQPSKSQDRSRREIREDLIESARKRLRGQSIDEFSTKNVVEDSDTSRQMIYTLFGGKAELLSAVYQEQARRLADQLDEVEAEDPVERFFLLGREYRQFMLDNAALFDRMLSLEAFQNYRGGGPLVTRTAAHEHFDEVLRDCRAAGIIPEDTDVEKLTDELWASVNGIIRLEIIGYFPDEETARDHFYDLASNILGGVSVEDLNPFPGNDPTG
jgi:AcrR family transcriptional regulator